MPTLMETLLADDRRDQVVRDCVKLIEQQVASRGLLRRTALSAGLAVLNAIKPNALTRAVTALLPDFAAALDPLYQRYREQPGRGEFSPFLQQHSDTAVDALIGVADQRIQASSNGAVKSAYARLRGSAQDEVRGALPGLAHLIAAHLPAAG